MAARSLSGPVVSMSGTLDRIRVGWNRAAIPSDPDPIYFKRGDDRGSVSCASKPAGGARPRGVRASALKRLPIWFGSRRRDRESVGSGQSVSARVDLGGRRIIKKKNHRNSKKNTK